MNDNIHYALVIHVVLQLYFHMLMYLYIIIIAA